MNRLRQDLAVEPASPQQAKNLNHLRAVIFDALDANRLDEPSLRRAVRT